MDGARGRPFVPGRCVGRPYCSRHDRDRPIALCDWVQTDARSGIARATLFRLSGRIGNVVR
jgi:hypothetical protein